MAILEMYFDRILDVTFLAIVLTPSLFDPVLLEIAILLYVQII